MIIQLEGGNDGLNAVIPVDDDRYYASTIAPHFGLDDARLASILRYAACASANRIPLYRTSRVNGDRTPVALAAYLNPARDVVRLTLPPRAREITVEIVDALGCTVMTRHVRSVDAVVVIDVSQLPAGTYMARAAGATTRIVVVP